MLEPTVLPPPPTVTLPLGCFDMRNSRAASSDLSTILQNESYLKGLINQGKERKQLSLSSCMYVTD